MLQVPDIESSQKELNRIVDLIKDRLPYIDSVAIWLPRHLELYEKDTIESLCGKVYIPDQPKPMFYQPYWKLRITLHQPTDIAFEYIDDAFRSCYLINHVALALDLTTEDSSDAEDIKIFIDQHLVKLWHGKQQVNICGDTSYSSSEIWVPNNLAIYADKPSKLTNEPACHVEWRINSAAAIRNQGINELYDLINYDHRTFWEKWFQLRAPDLEIVGKKIIGESRRRKPLLRYSLNGNVTNIDTNRGRNYVLKCHRPINRDYPCVQEFIDHANFNTYPYLKKLPTNAFLPQ